MNLPSQPRWLIAGLPGLGIAAALVGIILATGPFSHTSRAATTEEVKAAAAGALQVDASLGVPHPINGPTPGTDYSSPAIAQPDATTLHHLQESENARINANFDENAAPRERAVLANVLDAETHADERILGGGIRNLRITSIHISDDVATVNGVYYLWSRFQHKVGRAWRVYEPGGDTDFQMTLVKGADGRWKVHTFTWSPAPGSEPQRKITEKSRRHSHRTTPRGRPDSSARRPHDRRAAR